MKFGQLIEHKQGFGREKSLNITREIFFFKNHAKSEAGKLVPELFLFFIKALYKGLASGLQLGFTIFRWCPEKCPRKITSRKIAPQESCFTRFLLLLTLYYSSTFSNFL